MSDLVSLGGTLNIDPIVMASKINFHFQKDNVILENKETSSVIIWVDETDSLQFSTFEDYPSQRMKDSFPIKLENGTNFQI